MIQVPVFTSRRFSIRAALSILILFFLPLIPCSPALGEETVNLGQDIEVATANERSTLDRDTRLVTSTADITLTNISDKDLSFPIHAVIDILDTDYGNVDMPDAMGGPGTEPYDRYYFSPVSGGTTTDLATLSLDFGRSGCPGGCPGDRDGDGDTDGRDLACIVQEDTLSPGASVSFEVEFVRPETVHFRYDVVVYGLSGSENLPPVANAGPDREYTLPPGFTQLSVRLDAMTEGYESYDPDGTIAGHTWTGTPDPEDQTDPIVTLPAGTHVFALVVTDNQGVRSNRDSVTITIGEALPVGSPPEISIETPPPYDVTEGERLVIAVSATDPDGDTVSISASPKLPNGTFAATPGDRASATFEFDPNFEQEGKYVVAFTARDSLGLTDMEAVEITVVNVNRPPIISVPDTVAIDEGSLVTIPIQATDADGDLLDLNAENLPENNVIFFPATGTITFAPDYDEVRPPDSHKEYQITCTASDGMATATETVSVTVSDVPGGTGEPQELILTVDPVESPTFLNSTRITGTVNSAQAPSTVERIESALITAVTPATGEQGQTLDITLTGETAGNFAANFVDGISQADFGPDIVINAITINTPSEAVVNITIDSEAAEGPRPVKVTSENETAVSVMAFNVTTGKANITGTLLDPDTGDALADATVTIQGTNITTITNTDGSFAFTDVPAGDFALIFNAPDHELITCDIHTRVGTEADVGTVKSKSIVYNYAQIPPAASLPSIASRGLGEPITDITLDDAKQLIIDAILAVGGNEAGVLDEYGNQLNPRVAGEGLFSLRDRGVLETARELVSGDTRTLGEILILYLQGFEYQGNPVPRLVDVLQALQQEIDASWWNPEEGSALMIALFNQRRQLAGSPPRINLDTTLNALQTYLMVSSLLTFTHNQTHAGTVPMGTAGFGTAEEGDGFSVAWERVFEKAEPGFMENLRSGGIQACADVGYVPGCKHTAELVSMIVSNDQGAETSKMIAPYFINQQVDAYIAEQISGSFDISSFEDAWQEAEMEARGLGVEQHRVVKAGAKFLQDVMCKSAGQVLSGIMDLFSNSIIEALRPDPPLIKDVLQLRDPTSGELSNRVKITFRRSLKDRGMIATPRHVTWFYELWREQGGYMTLVTSGRVRAPSDGPGPRLTMTPNELAFYDLGAPEGTVTYRVRAARKVGTVVADEPPNALDTLFSMAQGLVPLKFQTPGGTSIMGGDTLKMLLDPAAKIIEGTKWQKSNFSDGEPVFVSLVERPPSPPANLAVNDFTGTTYVSIPFLNSIFSAQDCAVQEFASAYFKEPHQIGLGIDGAGNLYADNAASDMYYGGRIFRYDHETAARSFVGSVNYYSLLIQYANPVMVQALAIGPSPDGEALYIADSINNRITRLCLPENYPSADLSHNVSQNYVQTDEFAFGPDTTMTFGADGTLYLTQGNDILTVPYGGGSAEHLFDETWAPSPFTSLSGIALDQGGNLYVSDSIENTIYQIPHDSALPGFALRDYDAVALKKLAIIRGHEKPSQVQIAPGRRGLVFFDTTGLHQITFGLSGRVTDLSDNPVTGAKIIAVDVIPVLASVTDEDGVFVLPNLMGSTRNVVDIAIRHDNRTQTQRVVLEPFEHNVVDFVFDPPPPPGGTGTITISTAPVPGPPPVEIDLEAGHTIVVDGEVTIPKVGPASSSPADGYNTRAYVLTPGDGMVVTENSTRVQGFVTDKTVSEATLILNGEREAVTVTDGKIDHTVALRSGENRIALEVKEGGAKGAMAQAAREAVEATRAEAEHVFGSFGSSLGKTGSLAGDSLRSQLEGLPLEYQASSSVLDDAGELQARASGILGRLKARQMPSRSDFDGLTTQSARIGESALLEQAPERAAQVSQARTAVQAAANSSAAAFETKKQMAKAEWQFAEAERRADSEQSKIDGFLAQIGAFTEAPAARDEIIAAGEAYRGSHSAVRSDMRQRQVPELENHQLMQQLEHLTSTMDTHLAAFSSINQSVIQGFRNLVVVSADEAQADTQTVSGHVEAARVQCEAQIAALSADFDFTPASTLGNQAMALRADAEQALSSLQTDRLPDREAWNGAVLRAGEFERDTVMEQHALFMEETKEPWARMSVHAAAMAAHDAAEAKLAAGQAQGEMAELQARISTEGGRVEGLLSEIATFSEAPAARDEILSAGEAYRSALDSARIDLAGGRIPASQDYQLMQRAQDLEAIVVNHRNEFSLPHQTALDEVRTFTGSSATAATQSMDATAFTVGSSIAFTGGLSGQPVHTLAADLPDASLPGDVMAAAEQLHTISSNSADFFQRAELPPTGIMGDVKAQAQDLKDTAQASSSPMAYGFADAVHRRAGDADDKVRAAHDIFSDSHAALAEPFQAVSARRADVEMLPEDARPATFSPVADALETTNQNILNALHERKLPEADHIGAPRSGIAGEQARRSDGIDALFTIKSDPMRVHKASDPTKANKLREERGYDVVITGRMTDRDSGLSATGTEIGVPGSERMQARTNRDGVFHLKIEINRLQGLCEDMSQLMLAKHDLMMSIVQNLGAGGSSSMSDRESLSAIILESSRLQDSPPAALSSRDEIVDTASEIEDQATAALVDVEAGLTVTQEQIDMLHQEIHKLQTHAELIDGLIDAQHDASMSIITHFN